LHMDEAHAYGRGQCLLQRHSGCIRRSVPCSGSLSGAVSGRSFVTLLMPSQQSENHPKQTPPTISRAVPPTGSPLQGCLADCSRVHLLRRLQGCQQDNPRHHPPHPPRCYQTQPYTKHDRRYRLLYHLRHYIQAPLQDHRQDHHHTTSISNAAA
jgi:hypothetical protein